MPCNTSNTRARSHSLRCLFRICRRRTATKIRLSRDARIKSKLRRRSHPRLANRVGRLGRTREEPINIEDAPSHPHFIQVAGVGEEKFQAFLGAPIIHHRQLYGVIVVQQQARRRFGDEEVAFLVTMSAQLGGVLAHAHATQKLATLLRHAPTGQARLLQGQAAVPGICIGQAHRIYSLDIYQIPERAAQNIEEEIEKFHEALHRCIQEMESLHKKTSERLPAAERALFDVYLKMLADS